MKTESLNTDLRYPIGKFQAPQHLSAEERLAMIDILRDLPLALRMATNDLSEQQLLTPYRDGGWTVAQVVHHLADSHLNSYIRFKLTLTEENPVIKPYEEALWAELPEAKSSEIEVSLRLLESLHARFVLMLEAMKDDEWNRTFFHPASNRTMPLYVVLALYAWHSEHHLSHITQLRARNDW